MKGALAIWFTVLTVPLSAQVVVKLDFSLPTHTVSPYLYGRNNSLSGYPGSDFTPEWTRLKDAKVRFFREGGGNNSTKYNWRRKLSSHPDWYNNVYPNDWDFAAQSLQDNIPNAQGMWSFQLIGKAAKTTTANFNDWEYNGSQWWTGVAQNLAGGGVVNPSGGAKALVEGDPELYLENWTADSTVGILSHWFDELLLDKNQLVYWSMDNEPEIWHGTHDDVMPVQLSAEDFMQRYFDVAKKARAIFPGIKLVGPVPANEWQWYNWSGGITQNGKNYPWLEYFIKRVAEEQQATGIRLLDVLDIHFYPSSSVASEVVQYHRVYFDKNYIFPEANGVKNVTGTWDNSQNKEYIFERCKEWLDQYMGEGHGVTFGVSETGINFINASTTAVWYASTLGEFMKHKEMELFSPWSWQPGMWEVLHLFSAYNKNAFVSASSSEEEFVSAYPTINEAGDSVTLVLVNRSVSATKSVRVSFNGFILAGEPFQLMELSNLPPSETFVSHTSNALKKSSVSATGNVLAISLPPMSVTSVLLKGGKGEVITGTEEAIGHSLFQVYPNPVSGNSELTVEIRSYGKAIVSLLDVNGKEAKSILDRSIDNEGYKNTFTIADLPNGIYFLRLTLNGKVYHRKISKL
ncbi:MAG: T9SS type A sorting domain-containing protein [Cyclobacteriaceae bacterium]|jgi:hypothetical protein|nr:T9SS type A sorting domain-containing protein [Cyclobacteriaceae bacterium]